MGDSGVKAIRESIVTEITRLLDAMHGDEEMVSEMLEVYLNEAKKRHAGGMGAPSKGVRASIGTATPSPARKMPVLGTVAFGVLEKLMNDFGDDMIGGMEFLGKHFDGIPEPDRSVL